MDIVSRIILTVLAVVGLIDLIKTLILFFMKTEKDKEVFIVVPIRKNERYIEIILRQLATRIKWLGGKRITKVVCLDCQTDEQTKTICRKMCKEYPFMDFKENIDLL